MPERRTKKTARQSMSGGFLKGKEGGRLPPPAWAVLPAPELLHRARDVAEHGVDLGADRAHGGDGGDGDQRGDQRVLDGGGALSFFIRRRKMDSMEIP